MTTKMSLIIYMKLYFFNSVCAFAAGGHRITGSPALFISTSFLGNQFFF